MISEKEIIAFAQSLGITDRRDVNQVKTVPIDGGKYATAISLHNKQGWIVLPGTEHKSRKEAEALGAEFLYDADVAQTIRNNYKALESEMHDNQSLDTDALRSESTIPAPSEGKYAESDGMIIGQD